MLTFYWHKFVIPYFSQVITALACFVVASAAGLGAPIVIQVFIDSALTRKDVHFLHVITAGIILLYLIRGVFFYIYGYTMAKAGNEMISRIRQDMFDRLQSREYAFFLNNPTGEIISFFTNDLWLIQQAVAMGIPDLIVESINLIAIMMIMIYFNWKLALVTFATLPFIIFCIGYFNKKIGRLGILVENTLAKVTNILHQSLMSIRVIQSYVREDYEYQKFSITIRHAASDFIKVQRLNAILVPLVEFLAAIGLTVIIWYGGREVINGNLTIGGMVAFLVYIINVPAPVRKISEAFTRMKMGLVAWERIKSLENRSQLLQDGTMELAAVNGKIEFQKVSFSYIKGSEILHAVTITAQPGDVVAIVGPSGAGKSSFANLLLRFYDPTEGTIQLDGVDIKNIKINSLRKHIGFIQQEPILFNTTVKQNILYGRPQAVFEEVVQAAKLANAHDFICKLPKGYDTVVGQLGGNLSGGQRQRVAIARAIITQPAILLLDEPTAALDAEAEKQVMSAIRRVSEGRTTFIITHNLSILSASDKVVYLVNGKIVEQGRHGELIERGGVYARAVSMGSMGIM